MTTIIIVGCVLCGICSLFSLYAAVDSYRLGDRAAAGDWLVRAATATLIGIMIFVQKGSGQ